MFKKKRTDPVVESSADDEDEPDHAYEDSWYRSLKARATDGGVRGPEQADEDDDEPPTADEPAGG